MGIAVRGPRKLDWGEAFSLPPFPLDGQGWVRLGGPKHGSPQWH